MRIVYFALLLISTAAHAVNYIPFCESESMVLEQVVHEHGKPTQVTTVTGSVFYYDTISNPNVLRLRTLPDGPGGEADYFIRLEFIIDEAWDPHYNCSLYLRYDVDGIMRDGFDEVDETRP
jgi:hypothetical protein